MKEITVRCDECLKQINENYIPILLQANTYEILLEDHFCSYECMKTYLLRKFERDKENE